MGKSGHIGNKIAATLASTGTPALFLHPAEGIHGDLGMVTKGDIVIALSNSGETEELSRMLPSLKRIGIRIIALTGNPDSTLAKNSDVVIDVGVKEEACPLGLAPTASTTATLAMGDALAVVLLNRKGFREEDFACFHPGGSARQAAAAARPGPHAHRRRRPDGVRTNADQGRDLRDIVEEDGRHRGRRPRPENSSA